MSETASFSLYRPELAIMRRNLVKIIKNIQKRLISPTKSHRHRNSVDAAVKVGFPVEIREIQARKRAGGFRLGKAQ
jgi:hypothetical protein